MLSMAKAILVNRIWSLADVVQQKQHVGQFPLGRGGRRRLGCNEETVTVSCGNGADPHFPCAVGWRDGGYARRQAVFRLARFSLSCYDFSHRRNRWTQMGQICTLAYCLCDTEYYALAPETGVFCLVGLLVRRGLER